MHTTSQLEWLDHSVFPKCHEALTALLPTLTCPLRKPMQIHPCRLTGHPQIHTEKTLPRSALCLELWGLGHGGKGVPAPRVHWATSRGIFGVAPGGGVLPASRGCQPGSLPNTMQCTGWPHHRLIHPPCPWHRESWSGAMVNGGFGGHVSWEMQWDHGPPHPIRS